MKKKRMSRGRVALSIILGILIVVLLVAAGLIINPVRTLNSLRMVDDHPLWEMTYYGGYSFLPKTIEDQHKFASMFGGTYPGEGGNCSIFVAMGEGGHKIYARNYDWIETPAMLLKTDPPGGYASISMLSLDLYGFNPRDDLFNLPFMPRMVLLFSPIITLDGMNEYGLTVAIANVPTTNIPKDPAKKSANSPTVLRLLLDKARNVDEALKILAEYNITDPWLPGHYLLADPSGKSVVVEYLDGKMQVIPNAQEWQAITNFYITRDTGEVDPNDNWGHRRYQLITERLLKTQGVVSAEDALGLLKSVSLPGTQWSVVYDMSTGDVTLAMGHNYEVTYSYHLKMKAIQK
jgi:hypothetical protein